jgi:hypothetical protein
MSSAELSWLVTRPEQALSGSHFFAFGALYSVRVR